MRVLVQFYQDGCENCTFLDMAQNRGRCEDCTTINFQGVITVIDPSTSWAAKWLHMGECHFCGLLSALCSCSELIICAKWQACVRSVSPLCLVDW